MARIMPLGEILGILTGRGGLDEGRTRNENPNIEGVDIDASAEMKKVFGEKLYEGAVAEATREATARKLATVLAGARQDHDEHLKTEQRLEERLRGELERANEKTQKEWEKANRLDSLVLEISGALESGRKLTGTEVIIGRQHALNPCYYEPTYLPQQEPRAKADGHVRR